MSLSKEITFKELLDWRLLFSVALIVIGIFDIWHVSDYVRNYEDQYTTSLGYSGAKVLDQVLSYEVNLENLNNTQFNLKEINNDNSYFQERAKGLPQKDFFNAIFMLCTGFFVTLIGVFKFYLWFERREILILIKEAKRK